ncbi:serine/threonine protein kinase [Caballeronia mineralivorans]|uniref:serine/threonine protein kinase n=1 Tax=Caballeronia mineralivorans TaxID=2010198 RepID=UPI000AC5451B|nr:protein kinase [Caballeronia mineralivorans]
MSVWVDTKVWTERWVSVENLGSGGQGVVLKARRLDGDGAACVKVLSKQKDVERRARFLREATAYRTCHHELVPALIETNAAHEDDLNYKLFIVTEYVPGLTLTEFIEMNGVLEFADAVRLTSRLLDTLIYLHEQGWVHRDIKPDNIIVRDDNIEFPVLLDFGLCFKDGISPSFVTELNQEVGNRFLRLPELGIGSANKQDVRSDLSFVGAILFFVMTGGIPASLSDGDELMPHQRSAFSSTIARAAGPGAMTLFGWFDHAFNPNVQRRYAGATQMLEALKLALAHSMTEPTDRNQGDLEFVIGHVDRRANQDQAAKAQLCDAAMTAIQSVQNKLAVRFKHAFVTVQSGCSRTPHGVRNMLGFANTHSDQQRFLATFAATIVGGEIVIEVDGAPVYRTEVDKPEYGKDFETMMQQIFTSGVRALIEDPSGQVVTRGFFKSRPCGTLEEVTAKSGLSGKPAFVIVFDDSNATMSKLDHSLGFFMEYQTTKELVDAHFETAIVRASLVRDAAMIPRDDPLETPRWIVTAPDGTVLVSESVYPNPDEGLKRVRDLIRHWADMKQAPLPQG